MFLQFKDTSYALMFSNSSTKLLLTWYAYLVMKSTLTKLTFESKTSVMQ